MFLSWFGAYLIFQSILPLKVDRYFITMAPALAYFIVLGLSESIPLIESKIKLINVKSGLIYVFIALIFLSCSTATFFGHTPKKTFTIDIEHSCQWINSSDLVYKDKVICSDYPNAVNWYLKKKLKVVILDYTMTMMINLRIILKKLMPITTLKPQEKPILRLKVTV